MILRSYVFKYTYVYPYLSERDQKQGTDSGWA